MRPTKIAVVGIAALLLATGAAAAMPGDAPDHAQPANETADGGQAGPPGDAPADDADRGPPVDMPERVPDHVSAIHGEINAFLDGTIDDLGDAVSDVTPSDDGDEGEAADDGGDADEESAGEHANDTATEQ